MSSEHDLLIEMGFPPSLVEEALKCTGNNGIEAAMEWIVAHQNNDAPGDVKKQCDVNKISESDNAETQNPLIVKSFKCDDCGKLLRTDEDVQLHSARSGHVNYSESLDEVKPLTEAEREVQMKKLQTLLQEKKAERGIREKEEELEREKQRRHYGKNINEAKAKFEEDEMRRFVEQKRREKEEDRAYKEKLKADIAREREEKKNRDLGIPEPVQQITPKPVTISAHPVNSNSSTCRIQIRFPIGSPIKAEFDAAEPLSAVILYASQHWPTPSTDIEPSTIQMLTNFPKRDFEECDLQKPLSELGLCPSAVLIARRKMQ